MFNLGISELFLFAVVALIVLGPDKLPEAARFAGRWYGKLKRTVNSVQNDIDRELRMSELKAQMQQELQRIKDLEAKMQAQYEQPVYRGNGPSMIKQPNPQPARSQESSFSLLQTVEKMLGY